MNIMKTDMLAIDSKARDNWLNRQSKATVQNQTNMSEVSFGRGNAGKKVAKITAAMALAMLTTASCIKEPPAKEPDRIVNIAVQNNDMRWMAEWLAQQAADREKQNAFYEQLLQEVRNGNAQDREFYEKMIARQDTIIKKMDAKYEFMLNMQAYANQKEIDEEKFRKTIYNFLRTYTALLGKQTYDLDALLQKADKIINAGGNIANIATQILALIEEQNNMMSMLLENDSIKTQVLNRLVAEAEKTNADMDSVLEYAKLYLEGQKNEIDMLKELGITAKAINKNVIKTKEDLANALGVSTHVINKALQILGWSQAQINTMNTDRIIDALVNAINEQNEVININGDKIGDFSADLAAIVSMLENKTISDSTALAAIRELLKGISADVNEILNTMKAHFDKYNADIDTLISYTIKNYNENKETKEEVKNYGKFISGMATDVKTMSADLKYIKENLNDIDWTQLAPYFNMLDLNQDARKDEIIEAIDKNTAKQDTLANKLDGISAKLDSLNFIVSKDVIDAINNVNITGGAVDMSGVVDAIDGLYGKLDDLLKEVKGFRKDVNDNAKVVLEKWNENNKSLKAIEDKIKDFDIDSLKILAKERNDLLGDIDNDIKKIKTSVTNLENKYQKPLTKDELDDLMTDHDNTNQNYYKTLLDTEFAKLLPYQIEANQTLIDILNKIPNPAAPDYSAKLDEILKAIKDIDLCGCNKPTEQIIGGIDG